MGMDQLLLGRNNSSTIQFDLVAKLVDQYGGPVILGHEKQFVGRDGEGTWNTIVSLYEDTPD
jgi:hypothetical protein